MPEVIFRHIGDVTPGEMLAQLHGDRRVGAHCRFLERAPARTVIHTEYDPNLIVEVHGHRSDHVIYVLDGLLHVGEVECAAGTMVLLEHGAVFGPLIAGPEGTRLLEFYTGDPRSVSVDPAGFRDLLAARGIVPLHPDRTGAAAGFQAGVIKTRTNLEVCDLERSIAFYREVLGFTPLVTLGDPVPFALLTTGGGSLALTQCPTPAVASVAALHISVDDVDAALERCSRAGATITSPITIQPWPSRDFVFLDPDGHQISVGEDVV